MRRSPHAREAAPRRRARWCSPASARRGAATMPRCCAVGRADGRAPGVLQPGRAHYAQSALASGDAAAALGGSRSSTRGRRRMDLLDAIALLEPDPARRRARCSAQLRDHPTLSVAKALDHPARGSAELRRRRDSRRWARRSAAPRKPLAPLSLRRLRLRGRALFLAMSRLPRAGTAIRRNAWRICDCPTLPSARKQLARARVLVVGDAMLDRYWFGAVDRISPEAPVPVVRVDREEERLGGAANVALNVKTLGAQATLLTVVGDDEPARKLRSSCSTSSGVDRPARQRPAALHHRQAARDRPRAAADPHRLRERARPRGAGRACWPTTSASLPEHDAVLFSDYGKGGLTHIPRMIELARARRQAGARRPEGQRLRALRGRHRHHAEPRRAGAGDRRAGRAKPQLRERAEALRAKLGLEALLLTRSEEGMSLFDAAGHVAGAGAGARGVRRHRRRRHRHRHARRDARLRPAAARRDADRQPRRRHRRRQVRHGERQLRGAVREDA